jgi:hypothetical protein
MICFIIFLSSRFKTLRMKIFTYSYLGFLLPMVRHALPCASRTQPSLFQTIQLAWNMIGAVFAAAAPGIPSWSTGFQDGNDMGGLIGAVLAPAGGFGKFLLVLIALSTSSACAPNLYSFGEFKVTCIKRCKLVVNNILQYFPIDYFESHVAPAFLLIGNCFMAIAPFFARVPRYVFTVVSTAM